MSKIEKAKEECGYKTSEDIFGLVTPTEHQCKLIDSVVDKIKAIEKYSNTRYLKGEEVDVLIDKFSDIEYEVYGLEDEIEKIRTALENVRAWGQEWKDLAKRLIEENDIPIEEI